MKAMRTTLRRTLILLAALLGAVFIAAACSSSEPAAQTAQPATTTAPAAAPARPVTVKIQDNTFETNWIENAIAKFIVEKGYGHKVEEVVLNTVVGQTALQKGDIDINIELWPGNMQEWWDEESAKGSVVKLGDIYEGGDQFWVIPKWVADQHNIKTVQDLKRPEVVMLFADPEDPKKGVFYNCIIGWQCTEINRTKFKAYGLDQYYNIVSPGASAALDAALVGPMKKKQPVFGYYWAPTSIYGAYEWHIPEEPRWSKECWDAVLKGRDDKNYTPKMACAYETQPTLVAASGKFAKEGPADLIEFFKKMNVGRVQVSQTAAWAVENDIQGKWEKAAVYYLKTFEERWKTWVPENVYLKVKAAVG
jgi:glycine betaine/proline transport system substrate-binding protein